MAKIDDILKAVGDLGVGIETRNETIDLRFQAHEWRLKSLESTRTRAVVALVGFISSGALAAIAAIVQNR